MKRFENTCCNDQARLLAQKSISGLNLPSQVATPNKRLQKLRYFKYRSCQVEIGEPKEEKERCPISSASGMQYISNSSKFVEKTQLLKNMDQPDNIQMVQNMAVKH